MAAERHPHVARGPRPGSRAPGEAPHGPLHPAGPPLSPRSGAVAHSPGGWWSWPRAPLRLRRLLRSAARLCDSSASSSPRQSPSNGRPHPAPAPPLADPGGAPPLCDAGRDFRRAAVAALPHWPRPPPLPRGTLGPASELEPHFRVGVRRAGAAGPASVLGPRASQSQGRRAGPGGGGCELSSQVP